MSSKTKPISQINWNLQLKTFLTYLDTHSTRILVFITLSTFLIGIVVINAHPPSLQWGQTGSWWPIALNLEHGQGYAFCAQVYFPLCGPDNQITASREPAPVLLFAALARLTRDSLITTAYIEILLHILVVWGIFLLTRQWSSPRAALFAASMWAVYPPALRLIPQLSGEMLATVCVTFGIVFLMRARGSNRTQDWLLAGFAFGVAALSRSAVLVIVGVVVVGLFFEHCQARQRYTTWLRPVLLVSLVVTSMIIPWVVRNKIALGKPVLGTTLTGYVIYRHNHILGSQDYLHYVGSQEARQAIQLLLARHPDLRGKVNEVEMDAFYRQEGIKVILNHPVRYALLSAFRFFPLWLNWQVREAYGNPSNGLDYSIMGLQILLLILAVAGLRGNVRRTWPLWASVAATSLAYMAIDSQLRYLVPVMPLVISLGTTGGIKLFNNLFRYSLKVEKLAADSP